MTPDDHDAKSPPAREPLPAAETPPPAAQGGNPHAKPGPAEASRASTSVEGTTPRPSEHPATDATGKTGKSSGNKWIARGCVAVGGASAVGTFLFANRILELVCSKDPTLPAVTNFSAFWWFAGSFAGLALSVRLLNKNCGTLACLLAELKDVCDKYGAGMVKWIYTIALVGLVTALYQRTTEAAKLNDQARIDTAKAHDLEAKEAEQRRTQIAQRDFERTQTFGHTIGALRSSLVAFGSDCIPRVRLGTRSLDEIEQCSKSYQGIESGYVALTWDVPLFLDDLGARDSRNGDDQVERDAGGEQGKIAAALTCAETILRRRQEDAGVSNPMTTSSLSYRHFVMEYTRALRGARNQPCLERAFEDLFIETRIFGCALVTLAYQKVSSYSGPDAGPRTPLSFCINQLAGIVSEKNCDGSKHDLLHSPWTEDDKIDWKEAFGVSDAGLDVACKWSAWPGAGPRSTSPPDAGAD